MKSIKTGLILSAIIFYSACNSSPDYKGSHEKIYSGNTAIVSIGDPVFACWTDGHFYPATVTATEGKSCKVHYPDDYDHIVWTGEYMRNRYRYKIGEQVVSMWNDKKWYPGRVGGMKKDTLHIFYDDGDKLWVNHGWVVPQTIYNGRINPDDLIK